MIWVDGRVVPGPELAISVLDRAFEHGLGLFETLRTWQGEPVLLPRHLVRLTRSAQELGVPLDPRMLPDAGAVAELRGANQIEGDARLRITVSGGLNAAGGSTIWLRAAALTAPGGLAGVAVGGFWQTLADDPLARYKSLNYWRRRLAFDEARALGLDELLSITPDGRVWEGSRTNLFVVRDGRIETPPASGPIVPGVFRALVCERHSVAEHELTLDRLVDADELFLTNAVQGIMPVRRLVRVEGAGPSRVARLVKEWAGPGPSTARVERDIGAWLQAGGSSP